MDPKEMQLADAMKVAIETTKKYNFCKRIIIFEAVMLVLLLGGIIWTSLF